MVDSEELGVPSSLRPLGRNRLFWLWLCTLISLTWTVVLGGCVFYFGKSGLLYDIKNAFAASTEKLLAEWATAKIELMNKEFGRTQETLSEFRLRMYGDSTDMIIVIPIMNSIPWPSQNLRSLLDLETGEPWEENQKQRGSFDISTAVEVDEVWNIYDLTKAITANSEQRSLVISQKPVGRWLDLAKQDEAIDNKYKVRLEETAYESDRINSIRMLQGTIAFWLLPICGIFCSFFALGAIMPWFSHTNRIIRIRRRLALSASIMWIGLMVPISIVWNRVDKLPSGVNDWNWSRGDELPSEVLAAAFLCPVAIIWLFYFLWSWTLREVKGADTSQHSDRS